MFRFRRRQAFDKAVRRNPDVLWGEGVWNSRQSTQVALEMAKHDPGRNAPVVKRPIRLRKRSPIKNVASLDVLLRNSGFSKQFFRQRPFS